MSEDNTLEIKEPEVEMPKTDTYDAEEVASQLLFLYTPKFNSGVDQLTSNALRRILKKLVSYPLNEKAYKATSQLEKDIFSVGDRLLEGKWVLLASTYANLIEKELNKEKKEETNG